MELIFLECTLTLPILLSDRLFSNARAYKNFELVNVNKHKLFEGSKQIHSEIIKMFFKLYFVLALVCFLCLTIKMFEDNYQIQILIKLKQLTSLFS